LLARLTQFLITLGPWAIILASFIDSAGVPLTVGVDALLIILSAKRPELAPVLVILAVAGSLGGNLSLFHVARKGGARLLKEEAPESRRRRFRKWFNRYGLVTVFIPALIPIPMPMKFFVVCSGALGVPAWHFILTVALARLLRYGAEAYLGVQMGEHSTRYLSDHRWELLAFSIALGVALYLLVRVSERWRSVSG
jgi:membrane protein YqaA with SNARE-associated domain